MSIKGWLLLISFSHLPFFRLNGLKCFDQKRHPRGVAAVNLVSKGGKEGANGGYGLRGEGKR